MQTRLLSLCLVLALLLCGCGQKAVAPIPDDTPSVSAKQDTPAIPPAEGTHTAPDKNSVETETEKPTVADAPVVKPAPDAPNSNTPAMAEAPIAAEPTQPEPEPVQPSAASCTVSIVCHTAVGKSDTAPASGVILSSATVTLSGGESVYDILCSVCSANGISLSGSSGYIKSIGGLAERACGGGSGWLYRVNGTTPGVGCGSYSVSDGDSIQWVYTCDMGNDL